MRRDNKTRTDETLVDINTDPDGFVDFGDLVRDELGDPDDLSVTDTPVASHSRNVPDTKDDLAKVDPEQTKDDMSLEELKVLALGDRSKTPTLPMPTIGPGGNLSYRGRELVSLEDGCRLMTSFRFLGGNMSKNPLLEFDMVPLLNKNSIHENYSRFDFDANGVPGILALSKSGASKDVLALDWFHGALNTHGSMQGMLTPSLDLYDRDTRSGGPVLFLYVLQDAAERKSLYVYNKGLSEGLAVKTPIATVESPEARMVADAMDSCGGDRDIAVEQIRREVLGSYEPKHVDLNWDSVKVMLQLVKAKQSIRGNNMANWFMPFFVNYFHASRAYDEIRQGMKEVSDSDSKVADLYHKYLVWSSAPGPELKVHSNFGLSLWSDLSIYSPSVCVKAEHLHVMDLDDKVRSAEISFGPRLSTDRQTTYANIIRIGYIPPTYNKL